MDQQKIKEKIIAYIQAAYEWHKKGNEPLTEGIGKVMADLEEEILTSFGLPFMAFQYSEILQLGGFSVENVEKRALKLIETLTTEATLLLLSPIGNRKEILKEAKSMFTDAVKVLPIIDISTNNYNLFLYYDYYFRHIIDEEQFLSYTKMATDADEEDASRIPFKYDELNGAQVKRLTKEGYPFIKEYKAYLKYLSGSHPREEMITGESNNVSIAEDLIIVNKSYITYIAIKDESNAAVELLIYYKRKLVPVRVWCSVFWLSLLLKCSKYWSLSIPFLYITKSPVLKDDVRHAYPKDMNGQHIETGDIVLLLEKSKKQRRKKTEPPYFEVLYMYFPSTRKNSTELPF